MEKLKSKRDKYIVKCESKKQTNEVLKYIYQYFELNKNYEFERWNYVINDHPGKNIVIYNKKPDVCLPIISFKEWQSLPDEEFILPEKWCVKVNSESKDILNSYKQKTENRDCSTKWDYVGYDGNGIRYWQVDNVNYTEITFEQFKEHVLGKENINKLNSILTNISDKVKEKLKEKYHDSEFNEKPKKIIGYKLVKQEYKEAMFFIVGFAIPLHPDKKYYYFASNSTYEMELKKAGVLDLWCKPVYKPETITLKSGVELSESDIEEVKQILNK